MPEIERLIEGMNDLRFQQKQVINNSLLYEQETLSFKELFTFVRFPKS